MKKVLSLLIIALGLNGTMAQTKVGEATLPNKATFSGHELVLNGAGIREKLWIDLYVGGLYLKSKNTDANTIISSSAPMAIKLDIVSRLVTQEKMIGAVIEGFHNTTTGLATKGEIDKFTSFFNEEIVKGNVYDIVAINNVVTVYKNGHNVGSISGEDFKRALFGIWLSDKPADKKLKKAMLGN